MKNIYFYGDSNTYGFDPITGRYPKECRWTEQLESLFRKNDIPLHLTARGYNGECIPVMSYQVDAICRDVKDTNADLFAVMLGSNDLMLNRPEPDAEEIGRKMKDFLTNFNIIMMQTMPIILVSPPMMKVSEQGGFCPDEVLVKEASKLGEVYRRVGRVFHAGIIDAGQWPMELSFDGVHLSRQDHIVFAGCMYNELLHYA
jgi:lysophospholipase L1-like esterase